MTACATSVRREEEEAERETGDGGEGEGGGEERMIKDKVKSP